MTNKEVDEQIILVKKCIEKLRQLGIRVPSRISLLEFDSITLTWESHKINNYEYSVHMDVWPDGDALLQVWFFGGQQYDFWFKHDLLDDD